MVPPLEKYYGGDRAWKDFVRSLPDYDSEEYEKEWKTWDALVDRVQDPDLARAIRFHFGRGGLEWLERKVPALDHVTPIFCLRTVTRTRRLREMLMRMPC